MKTSEELANAVQLYKDGNPEVFAAVYEQSYRYLHACVMHVVNDEETAQDMLQETYLEIVKSAGTLKDAQNFLNWAAVIANRKCFAYLKKNKNLPLEDMDGVIEEIPDDEALIPEELMQDGEKRRLIREIIDGLSDMQRLCVIGYYYNEQSQENLAEEFGVPVGTVKSHLSRARAKIKLAVEELDVKKGTRLYNVAPLMFVLLEEEAKACILKPMSAALTGIAGAEAAGKVSFFGKLKATWAKLSAGAKAKVAVGAAAACTAGVAGVLLLTPKTEMPVISEETKNLFDQVMQIYETGNLEELCLLDFSVADDEEDYIGSNTVYYRDENGERISDRFSHDGREEKVNAWYYDGESRELKPELTGYGILVDDNHLAVGYFKDGQVEGRCISFGVRIINDEATEWKATPTGIENTMVGVTELNVENGIIAGEVTRKDYRTNESVQPRLMYTKTGNAALFHEQGKDGEDDVLFGFTGRVGYITHYLKTLEQFIYLKHGRIDPKHYKTVDGKWVDDNGEPVGGISHLTPEDGYLSSFLIGVSKSLFDLEAMEKAAEEMED